MSCYFFYGNMTRKFLKENMFLSSFAITNGFCSFQVKGILYKYGSWSKWGGADLLSHCSVIESFFILSTNPQGFVVNVHFPGHSSCWTWWETATSSLLDWSTVCFLSFFIVGLFEILANYFIDPAVWFFLVSCIIFNFNSISSPRQCVCVSANKISHSLKV